MPMIDQKNKPRHLFETRPPASAAPSPGQPSAVRERGTELPVGSGGGKSPAGTRLTVRYETDDPQAVARDNDVEGSGATVPAVVSDVSALLFLVMSAVMVILMTRQRRVDSVHGRTLGTGDRRPEAGDRQPDE